MNRKQLLAALTAAGYTGKADLAEIKQYLANEGRDSDSITINDETHKIDDVWAKAAPLSAKVETEADETVIVQPKKKTAPGYAATVGQLETKGVIGAPAVRSDRERAVKAYNRRIADSAALDVKERPAFDDGEQAEQFGAWVRLASFGSLGYNQKKADLEIVEKASVEWDNTLGGSLVPDQFVPKLIWLTEYSGYGKAVKIANVVQARGMNTKFPRGTSIGAMTPSGEGANKTAADDTIDNVELVFKEASLIKEASYQLLDDSAILVGDWFARNFAEAANRRLDLDYFCGDGTSTYNGHIGLFSRIAGSKLTAASGSSWASWTSADFNKVLGLLEYVDTNNLAFVGSRQNWYNTAGRLSTNTSQFANLVGPGRNGAEKTFLDIPYHFCQVIPESGLTAAANTTGNGVVFVGDFKNASMIGIRDDLRVQQSVEYGFQRGTVAWRGTMRYAVNIHLDGRGATNGPILGLKNS